ncbi:HK97 family phage prohead protease [Rathayibacter sp. CAU 1779]
MPAIDTGRLYRIGTPGLSAVAKTIASSGIDRFRKSFVYGRAVSYGTRSRNDGEIVTSAEWSPDHGIPLTIGHDGQMVGRSVQIEETPAGLDVLWEIENDPTLRIAVLDALRDGSDALSIGYRRATRSSRAAVHEASLVPSPAFTGSEVRGFLGPEVFATRPGGQPWHAVPGPYALELDLLGHEATLPSFDVPQPVYAPAQPLALEPRHAPEQLVTALAGLEVRSADGMHYIELRCVPYNTPTMYTKPPEKIATHAFASVTTADPGKIRLVEDHAISNRPVGVAQHFQDRADGLYGSFRLYDTPSGRGALENAMENTYGGCSIGFVAQEEHREAGLRVITKARLHHVALVNTPAYTEATILGVR